MSRTTLSRCLACFSAAVFLLPSLGLAEQRPGLFGKLLGKKSAQTVAVEGPTQPITEVGAPTVPQVRSNGTDRYPSLEPQGYKETRTESEINALIDSIYSEYEQRVSQLTAVDLQLSSLQGLASVPRDFTAAWTGEVRTPIFASGSSLRQDLVRVYESALRHSNTVKVFSDLPLIRETAIAEAMGEFDLRFFGQGQFKHTDEPTTSELTTGFSGRLVEDLGQLEYGLRQRLQTGAEVSMAHRLNTLESNSTFVDPNPQTGSELVFSVVQPLLRGGGFAYNRARLKVAELDAELASAEFLRALEDHLIEVNRAYWEVYLARAAFIQKRTLVRETDSLVQQLEDRTGVDAEATRSELLRARSSLSRRQAALIRSEMAIRNAEERLRSLVNDPEFAMGSGGEFIPMTRPVSSRPESDVKATALAALYHRPEVVQSFARLRAAGLRRDVQENELKPELNLLAEAKLAGLDEGRQLGDPIHDQFVDGPGWTVGFTYEQSLEKNLEFARMRRRDYELRQQANQLRATIDQVLLESVVSYRELMTAYRDMQGRYQAVLASREELRELKERLDVDTRSEGQTVGYQLQLILDALERNQVNEEQFLVSLVAYNSAFASLERAKGTLLEYYDVSITRQREETWKRHKRALETITASLGGADHDVEMTRAEDDAWRRHNDALMQLKGDK